MDPKKIDEDKLTEGQCDSEETCKIEVKKGWLSEDWLSLRLGLFIFILSLSSFHGYDLMVVTSMIGRQLPFFSLMVPFWLIWAFAGRKAMM